MIGTLILATLQVVATGSWRDCELLMRFLGQHQVDSGMIHSSHAQLMIDCAKPEASKLLRQFADEFGVDFSQDWPAAEQKSRWPIYSVQASETEKGAPWTQFASDSLFMKAYRKVATTEKGSFVGCRYWMRP